VSKRILVFGGSGKLGSAIRKALTREDCQVAFTYKGDTPPEPGSLAFECDLRNFRSVKEVVDRAVHVLGGLDGMVQAAGVSGDSYYYRSISSADYDRLQPVDQESFDECMEINARGSFAACQAVAPFLKGSGNIVLLGAIDGIKPVPAPIHFAASQAALRGLTEALAKELGHHNVCVNLVALGILQGGLSDNLGQQLKDAYLTHCALKRLGTMEEVAELVAFLLLENTYVTGQTLILDGGL
jgi:3-oxoacyl-[acyl-carrier protein] reductase